ncbi:MAG: FixH family protein [bacterium]
MKTVPTLIIFIALLLVCSPSSGSEEVEDRSSGQGNFLISAKPLAEPVPLYAGHDWLVTVKTKHGEPVEGARIVFGARMMMEGIPMGTVPSVEELGEGRYRVKGVAFLGAGVWTVFLDVHWKDIWDGIRFDVWVES